MVSDYLHLVWLTVVYDQEEPFLPAAHSGESLFPNICGLPLLLFFWLKWAGNLAVGRPESSSSNIWQDKPFWCVKPNARRLTHLECDHAHSFTHQKGLPYQIIQEEDSGLPQQGILPISAKNTITMATENWGLILAKKQEFFFKKNSYVFSSGQSTKSKKNTLKLLQFIFGFLDF